MTRTPLAILTLATALLLSAGCVEEATGRVIPAEIESWLSEELLEAFEKIGLTIHGGDDPPALDGLYYLDDARITGHEEIEMIGRRVKRSYWDFFPAEGNRVLVNAWEEDGLLEIIDGSAVISGAEDCFSIFFRYRYPEDLPGEETEQESGSDGESEGGDGVEEGPCPYSQTFIISGCVTFEGIADFQVGERLWRQSTEDGRCEGRGYAPKVVGQSVVELILEEEE